MSAVRSTPERRRWIAWAALATAFVLVNLLRLSTAVLAEELASAYAATAAELGTLHAAFFYIYAPLQIVAGVLADRAGIRRTATIGVAVMSAGALGFALADTYPVAFAARLCIGLGGSVVFVATLRFCANWFPPRAFATMSGVTVAIAGVGGILATTPLAVAVAAAGWRAVIAGLAAVGLALAAGVSLLVRDTPADAGLPSIAGVPDAPTLTLGEVGANALSVLRGRDTWLAGIVLFAGTGVNITVIGLWGVPYVVQTYGVSVTRASTYTLLGSAGLLLGPPLLGRLSDRLGRRTGLIVAATALHATAFGALAVAASPPLLAVGAILFLTGFLAGGFTLTYTVVRERHGSAASGVATGTVNALGFSGAAVFPVLMGTALDTFWTGETVAGARVYSATGYRVAFGLAALAGVAAFAAASWLHVRTRRRRGKTETTTAGTTAD
ncbi:MFS transporter [Halobacteriales archaeon QS_4_69_34]|nr:MAG: MFS transporter [Halobacteriales archaeon QS_4_69_34]